MPRSSYKTFLMVGTDVADPVYSKLIDIKDFPDLGGTPDMIQTTSLSDKSHTYIPGIDNVEALEFTANYTGAMYQLLKTYSNAVHHYSVWMGGTESGGVVTPTGSEGKFSFDGYLNVVVSGAGVNEVVDMTISIAPTTPIKTEN